MRRMPPPSDPGRRRTGSRLDPLAAQLEDGDNDTLIVVQHQKPDLLFSETQQRRLAELMSLWRAARDRGSSLSPEEQTELDQLVEKEVEASSHRTAAVLRDLDG